MTSALCFNSITMSPVIHQNNLWIRAAELARAIGYASEKSIANIYKRHESEFSSDMSVVINLSTTDIPIMTRIFSLRGCHLIAMFSRTPVAKQFRRWVLDVLDNMQQVRALPSSITPSTPDTRRPLEKLVKVWASQAHMPHAQAWTQVNAHFTLNGISELPVEWIPDAVAFVEGKIDALPKALPAGNAKQEEYRRRCHREDLELALKMIHLVGLEVAAQCKVIQRILNNKIETMP